MLTSAEIIQYLRNNKNYFRENFYCVEIGLFGSFARNEQNENSDIDILVTFDQNTPDLYMAETQLKQHLNQYFNRNIDICSKKWIKPIFRSLVLKEAIYA